MFKSTNHTFVNYLNLLSTICNSIVSLPSKSQQLFFKSHVLVLHFLRATYLIIYKHGNYVNTLLNITDKRFVEIP